jgi:hypothetical protein
MSQGFTVARGILTKPTCRYCKFEAYLTLIGAFLSKNKVNKRLVSICEVKTAMNLERYLVCVCAQKVIIGVVLYPLLQIWWRPPLSGNLLTEQLAELSVR